MSKTTRKVRVPATTDEVSEYACDKCGASLGRCGEQPHGAFGFTETVIRSSVGERYGGEGNRADETIDCCRACWQAHAKPALLAAGFVVREEEVDW